MKDQRQMKIEELPQVESEELTPEEAEQAQGGLIPIAIISILIGARPATTSPSDPTTKT